MLGFSLSRGWKDRDFNLYLGFRKTLKPQPGNFSAYSRCSGLHSASCDIRRSLVPQVNRPTPKIQTVVTAPNFAPHLGKFLSFRLPAVPQIKGSWKPSLFENHLFIYIYTRHILRMLECSVSDTQLTHECKPQTLKLTLILKSLDRTS